MMAFQNDGPLIAVLKAAVDAMVVINDKGVVQQVSDSVERLFGYSAAECIGQNVSMLMPEPDRSAHDGYIANYLAGAKAKIIGTGRKTIGRKKTGEVFPMHLSVGQFDYEGRSYFVGICHDLSEYTETLDKLHKAEQRYKDIVESQNHFICRLDSQLRVTFANTSLVKVLGRPHEEVLGVSLGSLVSRDEVDLASILGSLFADPDVGEVTIKVQMRSRHSEILAEWSFRKVEGSESHGEEIQGLGIDISEKEAAISRAQYLQDHDQLTGLLNSRSLLGRFEDSAERGQLYGLFHLDVDRFRQINQRYGYKAGDRVLVEIASRIKRALPSGTWLARPGGDELLVVSPVNDHGDAALIGGQILGAFSKPFRQDGHELLLDGKLGVTLFPLDCTHFSRAPELAEAALRDAKAHGESIVFFSESSHKNLLRRIIIEQALKSAFNNKTIEIHLQSKVNLISRNIQSYEALARWHHDELGQISPAEFIPLAEASGMGPTLDRYILRQVAEIISGVVSEGKICPPIAVNITADHFSENSIFDYLSEILSEFSLPPSAIELEITERVILNTCNIVSDNFERLRHLGVKISIDDFGTGYSSLSYLKKLEVDELKIDKSFIDDIDNPKGEVVVRAVIGIAHAYGLAVTAEGVETESQAKTLTDMGCALAQGYYFSRPMAPREALS